MDTAWTTLKDTQTTTTQVRLTTTGCLVLRHLTTETPGWLRTLDADETQALARFCATMATSMAMLPVAQNDDARPLPASISHSNGAGAGEQATVMAWCLRCDTLRQGVAVPSEIRALLTKAGINPQGLYCDHRVELARVFPQRWPLETAITQAEDHR